MRTQFGTILGVAEAAYAEIRAALRTGNTTRAQLFINNCFPGMPPDAQRWLLDLNNFPAFSDDGNTILITEADYA